MGILKNEDKSKYSVTVECYYRDRCASGKTNTVKCATCTHNTKRNFMEDFYKKADDADIPDACPPLSYRGPAEQSAGYQCPVCGGYTNPYAVHDNLCSHCGYRLNLSH